MTPMTILLSALGVYLSLGVPFAAAFVTRGVQRLDPAAVNSSWSFRLLILPGVAALWPFLLRRWMRGSPPPAPPDPRAMRIERTRRVLLTSGAWWAAVLLFYFIFATLKQRTGAAP